MVVARRGRWLGDLKSGELKELRDVSLVRDLPSTQIFALSLPGKSILRRRESAGCLYFRVMTSATLHSIGRWGS